MNDFSLLCRVLGTLFYRAPQDEAVAPLLQAIRSGQLAAGWPLQQSALLTQLQKHAQAATLAASWQALFGGESAAVSPYRSAWPDGGPQQEVIAFYTDHGIPHTPQTADHFGALLLAASWLEDHYPGDAREPLLTLFERYLLPWSARFLGQVEAHTVDPFWRALAMITREALAELHSELLDDTAQPE